MKKKLAVLNWAGNGNLGDELFNDAYKELFPNWDIHFFSNSTCARLPMIDFDVVNECDLFALGGGELINSDRLFIPSYWANKIKPEIPKIILGCGVNAKNIRQIKLNVLQELSNFCYIGLRDSCSVRLLSLDAVLRQRIGLFYDLVFSCDVSDIHPKESVERVTVVVPTDRLTNKYDKGINQCNLVKKSLKWLKNRISFYDKVVFLAFGSEDNDDHKTCLELSKFMPNASSIISDCYKNKKLMLEAIASAGCVCSYRLHGLILAKMFDKHCAYYPYHWKLGRVADTLMGCDSSAISVWQRKCLSNVLEELGLCG